MWREKDPGQELQADNQLQLQHEEKSDLNQQFQEANNLLQQECEEKRTLSQQHQDPSQLQHKEKKS